MEKNKAHSASDNQPNTHLRKLGVIQRLARIAVIPTALVGGVWFAKMESDNSTFNNFKNNQLGPLIDAYNAEMTMLKLEEGKTVTQAAKQVRKNYQDGLKAFYKEAGLENSLKKFLDNHPKQQFKAVLEGVAVGSILFTTGLALTNWDKFLEMLGVSQNNDKSR